MHYKEIDKSADCSGLNIPSCMNTVEFGATKCLRQVGGGGGGDFMLLIF